MDRLSALLDHHVKGSLLVFGDISSSSQYTRTYAPTFILI